MGDLDILSYRVCLGQEIDLQRLDDRRDLVEAGEAREGQVMIIFQRAFCRFSMKHEINIF